MSASLATCHLSFSFLLSLYLGLDCLPVNLDLLIKLSEAVISLFLVVLFEEAFPVGNDSVDVRFLGDR